MSNSGREVPNGKDATIFLFKEAMVVSAFLPMVI